MFSIKDDRVASRKKMVAFKSFGHPRKCPQKFTEFGYNSPSVWSVKTNKSQNELVHVQMFLRKFS